MPSFRPLAAEASPAARPAAARAVVPYRTFFITKVPFSSSEPTALGAASVRLLEPPKSWAPSWPRQRTRKEFDALNVKLAKRLSILIRKSRRVKKCGRRALLFGANCGAEATMREGRQPRA